MDVYRFQYSRELILDIFTSFLCVTLFGVCLSMDCSGYAEGECCAGSVWNAVSNSCVPCPPGYWGLKCNITCKFPYYGMRCLNMCNCSNNTCDPAIGCEALITLELTGLEGTTFTESNSEGTATTEGKPDSSKREQIKTDNEEFSQMSTLGTTVVVLAIILSLVLFAYVGMIIARKIIDIQNRRYSETQEGKVHYTNVNEGLLHI